MVAGDGPLNNTVRLNTVESVQTVFVQDFKPNLLLQLSQNASSTRATAQ